MGARALAWFVIGLVVVAPTNSPVLRAQGKPAIDASANEADTVAPGEVTGDTAMAAETAADSPEPSGNVTDTLGPNEVASSADEGDRAVNPLNLWKLLVAGGSLMIPLAVMSVAVVMIAFERTIALRRGRILPRKLVDGLAELGAVPGLLDPRKAYRLCQQYPSPAAHVIRAMLLKTGRPQAEIEKAATDASQREADRLHGPVRWLHLFTAVAPLIGLLGTVWGMILAFYETTQLTAGQNRAESLAEGIYIALVTTLGGLSVAIPAAMVAHYFEGRLVKIFHEIDELLGHLLPQMERFEGRLRVTPHSLAGQQENGVGDEDPPAADGTRRDPAHARG